MEHPAGRHRRPDTDTPEEGTPMPRPVHGAELAAAELAEHARLADPALVAA